MDKMTIPVPVPVGLIILALVSLFSMAYGEYTAKKTVLKTKEPLKPELNILVTPEGNDTTFVYRLN